MAAIQKINSIGIFLCKGSGIKLGNFTYQPDDPNKDNGADDGNDQIADQSSAVNAKPAEDAASDPAAYYSDNDVNNDAEAIASHDFTGKPSGYSADNDDP